MGLLQEGPSRQAARRPEAVALVFDDEAMTYGELEAESNRLARMLRAAGCERGDRVALVIPKSPYAIVAILGVLKAGGIYVPVDVANPAPRIARILARSGAKWALAGRGAEKTLGEALSSPELETTAQVGWLEAEPPAGELLRPIFTRRDFAAASAEAIASAGGATDAAHILFTSGSTGEPKGVVIRHANVLHFIEWAIAYFGIGPDDRHSGHPPLHFDLSTFDIFGTLTAGAQLHLVRPELNLIPTALATFIRRHELTQWFSVPSILTYMAKFDVIQDGDFPTLRRLLWCGEVFPTPPLIHWMKKLPHVSFTNLYGPTEATIASSYHTLAQCPDQEDQPIPIGRALPGEELLVLTDDLGPTGAGEIGNLYIRGAGLSPGYWRDPEKTAAVFIPNPDDPADRLYRTGDLAKVGEDGLVLYVGRSDSQIKSRGYRIELGEIEAALHALPGLLESAVVGVELGGFEGKVICCAYVVSPEADAAPPRLRRLLAASLPSYMLPSRWMALPMLPKNANGKVDRRALAEAFARGPDAARAEA